MKKENKKPQIVKELPRDFNSITLSKSNLHTYFGDKMALFSIVIEYMLNQAHLEQSHLPKPFTVLYNKLLDIRTDFLNRYHQLSAHAGNGITIHLDKIKTIFEHIYQFENQISEILNAGIRLEELFNHNNKNLIIIK